LPEEKWLSADGLLDMPVWRTRKPGDYITLGNGRKKLKEFMIDEKIPREVRETVPLLADGSHVLWVYGYRISETVKITENTQQVLHVRRITNGI
jgi:tRNA(Ile)-lysidine synthase